MDLPAAVPSDLCLPCHKHCQLSLSAMSTYKSPAKKTRSFKRLLKFIKNKCLEEVQPVLTIAVLPSTSFTPSPTLSFSRTDSIDVPPDVSLSTEILSPCNSTNLSPSLSTTPDQAGHLLQRDVEDSRKRNLNELRLVMGLPPED